MAHPGSVSITINRRFSAVRRQNKTRPLPPTYCQHRWRAVHWRGTKSATGSPKHALASQSQQLRAFRRRTVTGPPAAGQGQRDEPSIAVVTADTATNCAAPLTAERLQRWHLQLFSNPTGHDIAAGRWRNDQLGRMQVVSRHPTRRTIIHFGALAADRLDDDMERFLEWFNRPEDEPNLLKAAITHLIWLASTPLHDGTTRRAAPNGPRATNYQKGRRTRPGAFPPRIGPSHGSQAIASPAHAVNAAAAGSPRPTPAPTYGRQCGHRGPRCRWLANGQSKRDGQLRRARQNRRY